MIDLHTHILPGIDDGSPDVATSIELLRRQRDQGVTTVVFTPHLYRDRVHPRDFLRRRNRAFDALQEGLAALSPEDRAGLPQ